MKNKLRYLKPVTPSSRGVVLVDKRDLWKGGPFKALTCRLKKTAGRNNRGVRTTSARGGGAKKTYRMIDFKRQRDNVFATVERIELDPNRNAFIALIKYDDIEGEDTKQYSYILATEKMEIGSRVISGKSNVDVVPGNCLELNSMPIGTLIHNLEITPGRGGVLVRSAGSFASVMGKEDGYAIIKMPSGEVRKIFLRCRATVGIVSNGLFFNQNLGKAGRNRHRGWRPHTRGIAKNPVDHVNGGRSDGSVVKKGIRTRNKKKKSFTISRRTK